MTSQTTPALAAHPHHSDAFDDNQLIAERREKLKAIREKAKQDGSVAFPNDFKPADRAADLFEKYDIFPKETLEPMGVTASVAGRMMLKRVMGKASFATLQDASFGPSAGRIQIYLNNESVGEDVHASFKHWDLGDIVAAEGVVFKTKTGELSIHATRIRLLTKSLRPLPDKFHGVHDQEIKYRQRYVDLMTDESARKRFMARSKAVSGIREFMVQHNFLEVETPMLHPIPGGANAKPFETHHNALGPADVSCALRPSCTSSACWWGGSSVCSKSTATSATKASAFATTPNSP
jgi:lysyl-tRNA synthetase class 2